MSSPELPELPDWRLDPPQERKFKCPTCEGHGFANSEACYRCDGSGEVDADAEEDADE